MATQLLTPEAIALTEKKMDMTLDEIIKMSKKPSNKDKKAPRYPVSSVKGQGSVNGITSQRGNNAQRFIDSKPPITQGVLAQKRSNFQRNGNQFPLTNNAAKRAAVMQTRNTNFMPSRNSSGSWKNNPWVAPVNAQRKATDDVVVVKDTNVVQQRQEKPRTMDALFANMKEERMVMVFSSQQQSLRENSRQRPGGRQQLQQQTRVSGFRSGEFSGHRFVNSYSR